MFLCKIQIARYEYHALSVKDIVLVPLNIQAFYLKFFVFADLRFVIRRKIRNFLAKLA